MVYICTKEFLSSGNVEYGVHNVQYFEEDNLLFKFRIIIARYTPKTHALKLLFHFKNYSKNVGKEDNTIKLKFCLSNLRDKKFGT